MLEAVRARLGRAAFLSLAAHLLAGLAMAFVLRRGLGTNPDLADRLLFLDGQRWLWRAAWGTWNAAALSVLWFFRCFVRAHEGDLDARPWLRPVTPLALVAVAADLAAEAIYQWVVPGLAGHEMLAWDRRAVLLTGFFANGLYTAATGLSVWGSRAAYSSVAFGAGALVVAAGAWLSSSALADSVAGMFWSNVALVPALLGWLALVGLAALRPPPARVESPDWTPPAG